MDAEFEHLCRVCAANTKIKNNSIVENVFIFKTIGLRDKLAQHLFLKVEENDPLPKVLCKSCYRQVEATASLSNIAKHTQRVLSEFLLNTVLQPKLNAPRLPTDNCNTNTNNANTSSHRNNTNSCEHRLSNVENDEFRPIVLTRADTTITLAAPQAGGNHKRDEVIISLTKKDNEVRSQQKQQQQKQQQLLLQQQQLLHQQQQHQRPTVTANNYSHAGVNINNLMLPRRNSVYVDTRFGSAPMSIAQRSMQLPPSLAPLHPEVTLSKAPKSSPEKKHSPAGVINFIQTHGRVTGSAPIVSTESSSLTSNNKTSSGDGRSAIVSISCNTPAVITASVSNATSVAGVPNLPSSVLQQKRRNLKNALNNIKAINSGQVSLLKSSQQRQQAEDLRPIVTTTVVHKPLFSGEPSVEEVLPEHIIIAAPKRKKEETVVAARPGPPKLQKITPTAKKRSPAPLPTPSPSQTSTQVAPKTAAKELKNKIPANMSSLTETLSLGNAIRDPDLLKLILKALKWPVTAGNCEEQMTRLKNSKFTVIMSDKNLLQDNDLTQLLGPYVGPMLAVAHQQQKQNQSSTVTVKKTSSPDSSPTQEGHDLPNVADLASAMPYKLPPETSVQLVPSSPTEQEPPQIQLSKIASDQSKRPQRKSRARDLSEVAAEEQTQKVLTSDKSTSAAARVTNEIRNINPMLMSQFINPADAINEALISILKQKQDTNSRRQRRSTSITSACDNLEDIVLVEPQPSLEEPLIDTVSNEVVSYKLPSQQIQEPPPITRPIIKRRKTVIQTSKQHEVEVTTKVETEAPKNDESISPKAESPITKEKEKIPDAVEPPKAPEIATEVREPEALQAPSSTIAEATPSIENTPIQLESAASTSTSAASSGTTDCKCKPVSLNSRKSDVKSALGQKLLEAIGLQQLGKDVPPESSRDTLRSALKRSLKQAQEQQQLKRVKQEEPVKQLADSTTKPGAGESAEEHKKAIAERELALLKRKAKGPASIKDEKSERTDVSSSSSRNRRNRKSKADANEEDSAVDEKRSERWDEDDELPLKTEQERGTSTNNSNRPTRTSKTMSKYYKGPGGDKALSVQKSQHAMGTRSTRQR